VIFPVLQLSMLRYIAKNDKQNHMKIIVWTLTFLLLNHNGKSQEREFEKFVSAFNKTISLPIEDISLLTGNDSISSRDYNIQMFDNQPERAKFYGINDSLYKVTTYGRVSENGTKINTWADESRTSRISVVFYTKIYAIGNIALNELFKSYIVNVKGYDFFYYDLLIFNNEGRLISLVNLYEAEYKRPGDLSKGLKIFLTTKITKEGIIEWHQERSGVTTDREYKLREDGILEIISQKVKGEFDY